MPTFHVVRNPGYWMGIFGSRKDQRTIKTKAANDLEEVVVVLLDDAKVGKMVQL